MSSDEKKGNPPATAPPEYESVGQPQQHGGYPPQQGGYPPQQGGYPPQQGGYPSQQGGYPPQQGGYPPQQGGYPMAQGYAPVPPQAAYPPPGQAVHVVPQRLNYNDYLGFSIFNLLCCCCCIGIAAIIKSLDVQRANSRGDPAAKRHSQSALTMNKVALGVGIVLHIIWIGTLVGLIVTGYALGNSVYNSDDDFWNQFRTTTPDYWGR